MMCVPTEILAAPRRRTYPLQPSSQLLDGSIHLYEKGDLVRGLKADAGQELALGVGEHVPADDPKKIKNQQTRIGHNRRLYALSSKQQAWSRSKVWTRRVTGGAELKRPRKIVQNYEVMSKLPYSNCRLSLS